MGTAIQIGMDSDTDRNGHSDTDRNGHSTTHQNEHSSTDRKWTYYYRQK